MARRARKGKGQTPSPPQSTERSAAEPTSPGAVAIIAGATAEAELLPGPNPPATPETSTVSREPGAERAFSNALIALFLLFQIAMPLRYYLGDRGYDERFSWRMFSSLRMQQCRVRVSERAGEPSRLIERQVNLSKELQVAWIGMLERYRPQVVSKLLARRCAHPDVREVRYERSCRRTDGSPLPQLSVTRDCARGELTIEGDPTAAEEATP